jgi:organic hydroperoxide reductase OsmC/OhrA
LGANPCSYFLFPISYFPNSAMSEHKATIRWSRDGKDFTYKTYSRDHVWVANGNEIPASATAAYLGNPNRVDPEAAFVAALSSCHMLTFLALACNKGFVVENYEDNAVGHLEKNAAGKMAVTRVDLHPRIAFGGAKQPAAADLEWLHDKAHKECFIANSVTTEVKVVNP